MSPPEVQLHTLVVHGPAEPEGCLGEAQITMPHQRPNAALVGAPDVARNPFVQQLHRPCVLWGTRYYL